MKRTHTCSKCGSHQIARIPDNPRRYASSNNIYLSRWTLIRKIPAFRYVCCDCGYVENWVESRRDLNDIRDEFGTSGH